MICNWHGPEDARMRLTLQAHTLTVMDISVTGGVSSHAIALEVNCKCY